MHFQLQLPNYEQENVKRYICKETTAKKKWLQKDRHEQICEQAEDLDLS